MIPQIMKQFKAIKRHVLNLNILGLICFKTSKSLSIFSQALLILCLSAGFGNWQISAESGKKKKLPVKEKKIIETMKETNPSKKAEEFRDADDDDKSEESDKTDSSDSTETSENSDYNNKENPYYKVVAKNGVVLRDKPTVKSKKILVIPEDTIGEILEETKERVVVETRFGNWLRVEYNGKLGWIFSGYTIVKEDKEDFLPLTLIGYFLIKTQEPVFYRKPGREILGIMPEYPEKGDVIPIYRKKTYLDNEYYYFELKSLKPNSEEIVVSWIGAKSGSFLSPEAFSAYTIKSRKKKPKGIEKEIISEMSKKQNNEPNAYNYGKIDIQTINIKELGTKKKKKAYIVGYPTGTKTKKGFGDYAVTHYLLWKNEDNFHSLLAGNKNSLKIEDIDKDGVPEVFAQFETKGEPPLCHIYVFRKGMFEQLFPNYLYCDRIEISKGTIEIQKEKGKMIYKYSKGYLEKMESSFKSESPFDE